MEGNLNIQSCFDLLSEQGFGAERQLFSNLLDTVISYCVTLELKKEKHFENNCEGGEILEEGEIGSENGGKSTKDEFSGSVEVEGGIDGEIKIKHPKLNYSKRKKRKGEITSFEKDKTKYISDGNLETTKRNENAIASEKYDMKLRNNVSESKSVISSPQCQFCPFTSRKKGKYFKSILRKHNRAEHHVCEICRKKLDSAGDLTGHMESVHKDSQGRMICGLDGCSARPKPSKIDPLEATVTHVRFIHDRILYICKECGRPYKSLRKHKALHSMDPNSLFTCEECQFICTTEKTLKRHKRVTHLISEEEPEKDKEDVKLPCDMCDFKTNGLSQDEEYRLILHKKVHQDGEMICNKCPFKSTKPFTLKRHLAEEHNQGRVFQCTHCDYKTDQTGHLKNHIVRHYSEKTFQCDQCKFSGKIKQSLDRHIQRAHQKEAPKYLCDECDYKSGDFSNFDAHRRVRHGSEVLACEDCDYKTKSRRSLRDHKTKHSTRLICAICGFATNSEKNLRTHKSESHNNQ